MRNLKLNKQTNAPDFDELYRMLSDLEDFLNEEVNLKNKQWKKNFNTIIDFQDDDGSFKLYDSYRIPTDARVDFCYVPTYICTAILMKAYLTNSDELTLREQTAFIKGLKMSCVRNLRGHGFEAFKEQISALKLFMKAGLNQFMDLNADLCPEFSEMISDIITQFQDRESQGNFKGSWNESYEDDIRAINQYFSQRKVFVYGTLMTGEDNSHFLENSKCLGPATLRGYEMYNVGWYPAIIPGESLIIGELYEVPLNDMPSIDMIEGEGSLYAKKCETVTDAEGKTTLAFVYVYLRDTSKLERIPVWNREYVWYLSYGSNMLEERFLCYIKGGSFEGSRSHPACEDTTSPLAVKAMEIPYDMYFANTSGSWNGCGVSFLDTTQKGKALGVAYLITKKQFEHVACRENAGRRPEPGYDWYEDIIDLGLMDCFEVKTITNNIPRDPNRPSSEYLSTLSRGIKQNWPDMLDKEIEEYLKDCIR